MAAPWLGSGTRPRYRDLAAAVREPARAPSRAAKGTVVLLHGSLGPQIGKVKSRNGSWDIVWFNPLASCAGDMKNLRRGAGKSRYGTRGLLPMFCSLLWARLKHWYGFNVASPWV